MKKKKNKKLKTQNKKTTPSPGSIFSFYSLLPLVDTHLSLPRFSSVSPSTHLRYQSTYAPTYLIPALHVTNPSSCTMYHLIMPEACLTLTSLASLFRHTHTHTAGHGLECVCVCVYVVVTRAEMEREEKKRKKEKKRRQKKKKMSRRNGSVCCQVGWLVDREEHSGHERTDWRQGIFFPFFLSTCSFLFLFPFFFHCFSCSLVRKTLLRKQTDGWTDRRRTGWI